MRNLSLVWLLALSLLMRGQYEIEWTKVIGSGQLNSLRVFENNSYFASRGSFGKLTNSGELQFQSNLGTAWINNLEIINSNSIFVGGDPASGIFDFAGKALYQKIFCWPDSSVFHSKDAKFLNGSIYFMRSSKSIYKYDLFGSQTWSVQVANSASNQKLFISDSHLYIYSIIYHAAGGTEKLIIKYDTLGNPFWQVDPEMIVQNIVTSNGGDCFVLGSAIEASFGVRMLNKHGHEIWWQTYPDLVIRNGFVSGDSLYICGYDLNAKCAMYGIISIASGQLLEKIIACPWELDHTAGFTHIQPTKDAVYLGGSYGLYSTTAFLAKFSDPRYVAVNENKLQPPRIKVFPNPARDEISVNLINWSVKDKATLTLRDQLGKIIAEQHQQNSSFNDNQYKISAPGAKGIYFLTVSDGGNNFTEKVIFD